ncbi:hypothetical protein [Streptomyces sp. SCL15-4]|uniref:hypothetical protein n=1 Tax=Streptomyces sp. SCL15-4 TaxID=2967221 RepID=UPI002967009D|nr:hypothetical protein [Streptomyces sp. SCL15-4]
MSPLLLSGYVSVPAVVGHAFVSSARADTAKEFAGPAARLDPPHMGMAGRPGWIATGTSVAFLALTGRLRPSFHARDRAGRLPADDRDPAPARTPVRP